MWKVAVLVCTVVLVSEPALCRVLNDFIRHFEPLEYDQHDLMWNHHRVRRSLMGPDHVELSFNAFGRNFNLVLEPERKLFHPDFKLTHNKKVVSRHESFAYMYSGYDKGDPTSRAHGNLAQGVFDGTIHAFGGIFHVEPTMRYGAHLDSNDTFHSLIYRHSDLDYSSLSSATCGSSLGHTHQAMLQRQAEAYEQWSSSGSSSSEGHTLRKKRQARNSDKTRCWLNVILDYKLYEELNGNGENAISVLFNMIQGASTIFAMTDFDEDGAIDGINFGVRDCEIQTQPPLATDFFASEFIGVSAFLNQHSQEDYSDYCLSYRFTYRDFEGGVVGLAYIGPQPNENLRGGICDGFSGGSTLNTGIVTSLNFGRRIPATLSTLTLAHEAGHNFGSQHDDESVTPADGAYIMYPFATDGSDPNNVLFSPASITMMDNTIEEMGQGADGCFVEDADLCGNMLLDPDEECDCGSISNLDANGICLNDPCCMGASCSLNTNITCSPNQGPCCNDACMYISPSDNIECSANTECALSQNCNGTSADCPQAEGKDTPIIGYIQCDNNQSICNGPSCNGSLCVVLEAEDCDCQSEEQTCHVCCQFGDQCISTIEIAANNTLDKAGMLPNMEGAFRIVGTPCNNFTGYCDLLNNCLLVDENGALFRLTNLFFNSEAFQRFLEFAQTRWWVLVIIAIVGLVGLFMIVMCIHCFLPRPKTAQSRHERRNTLRERRRSENAPQDYTRYSNDR